jgi:8-amino-7-oxononanoate synthase
MSLFDKYRDVAALRQGLGGGSVSPVATPMQHIHSATEATIGGRRVILAGTNNYLGLTYHPEVRSAAKDAIDQYGTGTTGSRMANGSYLLHGELECAFAEAYGWPSAMVFSTGYQANLGAISALAGPDDFILADADSHASINDGCRLSAATVLRFRHNDPESLDKRLSRLGEDASRALVVIEGLYSMLGDRPPLKEFVDVKKRHGAWLLVDEAHSFGVMGERGLGLVEQEGVLDDVDFVLGTFSKSLGSIGGFCVSPHPEMEWLRLTSRPYIFTASSSPAVIAGTQVALRLSLAGSALRKQLWRNIERFYAALNEAGYQLGSADPGPVAAIVLPDTATALAHWRGLMDAGVYANLMIPPATPGGLNLLRISLSAAHTDAQIDHIIAALNALAKTVPVAATG